MSKMHENVQECRAQEAITAITSCFLTVLFRTIHSASHWVMLFMEFFLLPFPLIPKGSHAQVFMACSSPVILLISA